MLFEFKRALHQPTHRICEETSEPVKAFQRLPVALLQLRLVIPSIHMARAAVDEEPNDRLRLGLEMRLLRRQRILRRPIAFLLEEASQPERANAHAALLQHRTAVELIESVHCT